MPVDGLNQLWNHDGTLLESQNRSLTGVSVLFHKLTAPIITTTDL